MDTEFLVRIVDDDRGSRESIAVLVESLDFATQVFASAEEFTDQYRGEPGCLITELRLPGMSGLNLLKSLDLQKWEIPVIVVSGYPETSLIVEVMQLGALTFLEKPYSENELRSAIQTAEQHHCEYEERCGIHSRVNSLSSGEQSVMQLMINGLTNKAIATRLDLGLRTAESRRRSVLQKMHVTSIAKLVQDVMVANHGRRPPTLKNCT